LPSPDPALSIEDGPLRPPAPIAEVHVWLAASGEALPVVLSRYLDEAPETIELVSGEHGKPALADSRSGLEFNLSHSGELTLIAVSATHPVGVDVESTGRRRDFVALARRELGADVVAVLEATAAERRGAIFYAAWARHEARAKCHGGGLGGPPPPGPVAVADLAVGEGYAAALAVPGEQPPAWRLYRLELR
jgi:4'-phosphopantetheinyl transferase